MPVKKERDRFSVKFNLNDPLHEKAVRLLEQQGPRRKAQFIANAILHYVNCSETPEFESGQPLDRSYVETMVLEILQQQKTEERMPVGGAGKDKKETAAEQACDDTEWEGLTLSKDVDEVTRALIADTMMLFRNN